MTNRDAWTGSAPFYTFSSMENSEGRNVLLSPAPYFAVLNLRNGMADALPSLQKHPFIQLLFADKIFTALSSLTPICLLPSRTKPFTYSWHAGCHRDAAPPRKQQACRFVLASSKRDPCHVDRNPFKKVLLNHASPEIFFQSWLASLWLNCPQVPQFSEWSGQS